MKQTGAEAPMESELTTLDGVSSDIEAETSSIITIRSQGSQSSQTDILAHADPIGHLQPISAMSRVDPAVVNTAEAHAESMCSEGDAAPISELEEAIQAGDFAKVKSLITPKNINDGALNWAASTNQWELVNYLLEYPGVDVNARLAPMNSTPLLWACRNGHAYIVKLLLDHGADPTAQDATGFSAIHLAVHSSNILMVTYMVHLGGDTDRFDYGHRTPLHWATVQGDNLSVEALLKAGASPNKADGEGHSPLALAVYVARSADIVALLLEHGADAGAVEIPSFPGSDPDSQASFAAWMKGTSRARRLSTGAPRRSRYMSPEMAKVYTFVAPLVVLVVMMNLPRAVGLFWAPPLSLLWGWLAKHYIANHIIPYSWGGSRAAMASTLFAGGFFAIFTCLALFWLCVMAGAMLPRRPWSSLYLLFSIFSISVTYGATLLMDPGIIEPGSMSKRLAGMNELLAEGHFDSVHLCVHTYVKIPARARYDVYLDRVVCRYDHYCPWLYNAIGVRNHRTFLLFLLALGTAVPIWVVQYLDFAHEFGASSYAIYLAVVTLTQMIWIYALTLVQVVQIAKASTSNEVSRRSDAWLYQTDPIAAYGSVPRDHPKAYRVFNIGASASSRLRKHAHGHVHRKGKLGLLLRLTGISQLTDAYRTFKSASRWNEADHGVGRNCMDFWLGGGSPFRPDGMEGLINGVPVDYAQLEYPEKQNS